MLLDTSGLLCCLDADEQRHGQALQHYAQAPIRLTHNYVIAELVALAQVRGIQRKVCLEFCLALQSDKQVEVNWVDPTLHQDAMQLLLAQPDKSYSLCDAISIVLMKSRGLKDALTTDRHFEQAGFERLLP